MDDNALLAQQYDRTLKRIQRASEGYDSGAHEEAYGLAGLIVNLIGDRLKRNGQPSPNFVSLSQRLGLKPTEMLDLSLEHIRHDNLHGPICAMGFHVMGAEGLAPVLDGPGPERWKGRLVPFDQWWAQPVIRDGLGHEHSRQSIIETMRDQEEAHVDSKLEEAYGGLAYAGALGIVQHNQAFFPLDTNPTTVAVRQVAHEVLRTFCPDTAASFARLGGGLIEPIALVEFYERELGGDWELVKDRGFWRYQIESTSDAKVIAQWREQTRVEGVPPFRASTTRAELRARLALLNFNDSPVECARVSMRVMPGDLAP